MYIIINQTEGTTLTHEGFWPTNYLENLLNKGDKLVVISLYSNTLKVPTKQIEEYDDKYWEFNEFSLDDTIRLIFQAQMEVALKKC